MKGEFYDFSKRWEAEIAKRSSRQRCQICSGSKVLAGYNDLATLKPELAKQWHPDNNKGLQADMVSTGSNKKYGGFAKWDMNGKHKYLIPRMEMTVLYVEK